MSESNFIQKVGAACNKKEDLYQKSKTRYAVRSIFCWRFSYFKYGGRSSCRRLVEYLLTWVWSFSISIHICLGLGLSPILKCGVNHLKYDVFDGGDLSKENSLEESAGNSSLLYLL